MIRQAVIAITLALLQSTNALAGGINLTWGAGCWPDNPSSLRTFSCDANTGSATMTGSFVPDATLNLFAISFQLDIQSDSSTLPDWWQLTSPGGCRSGALSLNADFSAAGGSCTYAWPGQAPQTAVSWRTAQFPGYPDTPAPNHVKASGSAFVSTPVVVTPTAEYYAFSLAIDFQKSSGVGACGGCSVPATIVLNEVTLYGGGQNVLTTPLANTCLRWQAGGSTPCAATPARNRTWGSIKSLYR